MPVDVLPASNGEFIPPPVTVEQLRIMQMQAVELSRATAPFTVMVPAKKRPKPNTTDTTAPDGPNGDGQQPAAPRTGAQAVKPETMEPRTFPAGSYILRMDQPYSRIADTLLDYQYWSPDDPQKRPCSRHEGHL